MLPYFVKSENNERGPDNLHGASGPLFVSDIGAKDELIDALVAGAQELGIPKNADFNGATQEGAGYYQLNTRRGLRCSTAVGYLRPIARHPKLSVRTGALASRILFDGRRAKGVAYAWQGGEHEVRARREVILSAGAIQSPQLLQLSGIGPADLLAEKGIPLIHASREVGENLQDHLQFRLIYRCTKPITTNDQLRSFMGRARIGLQWLVSRSGPLAVGINQGGIFARALPESHAVPMCSSIAPRFPPTWRAARCMSSRGSRFPSASFGRNRVASSACARAIPRSRPRCSLITSRRSSTGARRSPASSSLAHLAATPAVRPYVAEEVKPGPAIVER